MAIYTAAEEVANILREKILSGDIPDNTELTQKYIAERLGVSRMPVREALVQLEYEGLMERLDNRHTRVIGRTGKSLASRVQFIASLESDAAIILSMKDDLSDVISELDRICSQPISELLEIKFHELIISKTADRFYIQIFKKTVRPSLEVLISVQYKLKSKNFSKLNDISTAISKKSQDAIRSAINLYYHQIQKDIRI